MQAYQKCGLPLAPGMEIGYVAKDAKRWEVDTERDASEFDSAYYEGLLEMAREESAFVFDSPNSRFGLLPHNRFLEHRQAYSLM